jgi:hypothetical protein
VVACLSWRGTTADRGAVAGHVYVDRKMTQEVVSSWMTAARSRLDISESATKNSLRGPRTMDSTGYPLR